MSLFISLDQDPELGVTSGGNYIASLFTYGISLVIPARNQ